MDELIAGGRATIVVVAHRLSTVKSAHKIIVIDDGAVVEQGTHEELLAARGLYSGLVARQMEPATVVGDEATIGSPGVVEAPGAGDEDAKGASVRKRGGVTISVSSGSR